MENDVKVTIGICVKNSELTIEKALDSVLSQRYPHSMMEIIVVDGCSKDKTLSIIKSKLANSDIKYRIFRENIGLGMARQIVAENASGKYIVWVDGDIVLSKDYVRKQVEYMEKHPNVAVAEGKYGICSENNLAASLENMVAVAHSQPNISNIGWVAATEGAIWRIEAIRQIGGFEIKIKGAAEDIEATYRMKVAGWNLVKNNEAIFQEIPRQTWRSIWEQYFWYGYGAHYINHKNKGIVILYKMTPLAGILAGVLYSFDAYKLLRRKTAFLLPFHYLFKRIAWCFGFAKAHLDGYGH